MKKTYSIQNQTKMLTIIQNHKFNTIEKYLTHDMSKCKACTKAEKTKKQKSYKVGFVKLTKQTIKKSKQKTKEKRSQKKIATVRKSKY